MKRTALGVLLISLSCWKLPAISWGGFSLVLTNETLLQRNRAASRPDQLYQLLHLVGTYKDWSSGLTLRLKNFLKQTPDMTLPRLEFDFYKAFVRYQGKKLRAQAGDFHAMLGRGLVLAVLPNEKLYRDWSIRGGDVEFLSDHLRIRTLGGLVRDEAGGQGWSLFGTEAIFRYVRAHDAGWHLSYIDDRGEGGRLGPRLTGSLSFSGSFWSDRITYAAETAFLSFQDERLPAGSAGFASLSYHRGRWLVTVEAKRYLNFANELNNPPNADREDEPGVLGDGQTVRLFLQYALPDPDLLVLLNAATVSEYGVRGEHLYAGMMAQDLFDRISASLTVGVRRLLYPVLRIDANLQWMLGGPWSLETNYREKGYRNGAFRFLERDILVQLAKARLGSFSVQYQYSAQPVMGRHHFLSCSARWDVSAAAYVEATGGWLRGGEVCAQGQCFQAPPFRGVKLSFFAVFR